MPDAFFTYYQPQLALSIIVVLPLVLGSYTILYGMCGAMMVASETR